MELFQENTYRLLVITCFEENLNTDTKQSPKYSSTEHPYQHTKSNNSILK